jgi:hypothetical protein
MRMIFFRPIAFVSLLLSCLSPCIAGNAQTTTLTALPDSPDAVAMFDQDRSSSSQPPMQSNDQQSSSPSVSTLQQGQQTKRILGIVPNFRAVSANTQLPPQSVRDKFVTASQDTFDYSAIIFAGIVAAEQMATVQTPEFHQGAAGYGRYFWHTFVDQSIENYAVEFIVPAVAHEDTRYYTLGNGGFIKRSEYALSRVVITRSDNGSPTFNTGEIIGAGAAAGISNLYYPSRERTFSNTAQRWGTNVGLDAITFYFKEFWPDINHAVFHAN